MYRRLKEIEFFLVHPGGPYFVKKDQGYWTIPKGEPDKDEELLAAAVREFKEETGIDSKGPYLPLGSIRQKAGKTVFAWAFEGDYDVNIPIKSNTFRLEWPPKSGNFKDFPEMDKAEWMNYSKAKDYIKPEQLQFLDSFMEKNK